MVETRRGCGCVCACYPKHGGSTVLVFIGGVVLVWVPLEAVLAIGLANGVGCGVSEEAQDLVVGHIPHGPRIKQAAGPLSVRRIRVQQGLKVTRSSSKVKQRLAKARHSACTWVSTPQHCANRCGQV